MIDEIKNQTKPLKPIPEMLIKKNTMVWNTAIGIPYTNITLSVLLPLISMT